MSEPPKDLREFGLERTDNSQDPDVRFDLPVPGGSRDLWGDILNMGVFRALFRAVRQLYCELRDIPDGAVGTDSVRDGSITAAKLHPDVVIGGGGGGGADPAVLRNLVFDWAEEGNTDLIPDTKLSAESIMGYRLSGFTADNRVMGVSDRTSDSGLSASLVEIHGLNSLGIPPDIISDGLFTDMDRDFGVLTSFNLESDSSLNFSQLSLTNPSAQTFIGVTNHVTGDSLPSYWFRIQTSVGSDWTRVANYSDIAGFAREGSMETLDGSRITDGTVPDSALSTAAQDAITNTGMRLSETRHWAYQNDVTVWPPRTGASSNSPRVFVFDGTTPPTSGGAGVVGILSDGGTDTTAITHFLRGSTYTGDAITRYEFDIYVNYTHAGDADTLDGYLVGNGNSSTLGNVVVDFEEGDPLTFPLSNPFTPHSTASNQHRVLLRGEQVAGIPYHFRVPRLATDPRISRVTVARPTAGSGSSITLRRSLRVEVRINCTYWRGGLVDDTGSDMGLVTTPGDMSAVASRVPGEVGFSLTEWDASIGGGTIGQSAAVGIFTPVNTGATLVLVPHPASWGELTPETEGGFPVTRRIATGNPASPTLEIAGAPGSAGSSTAYGTTFVGDDVAMAFGGYLFGAPNIVAGLGFTAGYTHMLVPNTEYNNQLHSFRISNNYLSSYQHRPVASPGNTDVPPRLGYIPSVPYPVTTLSGTQGMTVYFSVAFRMTSPPTAAYRDTNNRTILVGDPALYTTSHFPDGTSLGGVSDDDNPFRVSLGRDGVVELEGFSATNNVLRPYDTANTGTSDIAIYAVAMRVTPNFVQTWYARHRITSLSEATSNGAFTSPANYAMAFANLEARSRFVALQAVNNYFRNINNDLAIEYFDLFSYYHFPAVHDAGEIQNELVRLSQYVFTS